MKIIKALYAFNIGLYSLLAYFVTGLLWVKALNLSGTSFIALLVLTNLGDCLLDPAFKKERAEHGLPEILDDEE